MENKPVDMSVSAARLSPWWRNTVILVLMMGFTVLIWLAVRSYQDAPPIPAHVIGPAGEVLFTA